MRRLSVVLLCVCVCACAEVELIEPPKPPQLVGPVPAVGRNLDLAVEGRGTPVRLRGVTGRVTAVCVLGMAGARGDTPGSEPATPNETDTTDTETATEEVPIPPAERPAPLLAPAAERVLRACTEVAATLADRIAVVALTTDRQLDLDRMTMRTYRDPDGKALGEWLDLPPDSQVLLVDQQGRVADVLPPDELDRLEPAARRLIY